MDEALCFVRPLSLYQQKTVKNYHDVLAQYLKDQRKTKSESKNTTNESSENIFSN